MTTTQGRMAVMATGVLAATAAHASTRYTLDADHSALGFRVRHMMVANTSGRFDRFGATLVLDEADVARSRVEVKVETASVNTNVAKRDEHLRSPDFLDVEKHPVMTFVSRKVEVVDGRWRLTGDLTIRGVTRPLVLDAEPLSPEVKDPWGNLRRGTRATGRVNRKDYGMVWNAALDAGGVAVGDTVELTLDLEFIRAKS